MDRTTAACAGLAINTMLSDSEGWDGLVVQIVRTGNYWHVEVRRDGDVYANGRDESRVDVGQPSAAATGAGVVGEELAETLDEIALELESDDPIQSGHIIVGRN